MDEVLWNFFRHHIRYKTTCGKKLQISKMLVYSAVLSGGFLNLECPWSIQSKILLPSASTQPRINEIKVSLF